MLKPVVEVKFAIRETLSSGFHCKEDLMRKIASLLAIACTVASCATVSDRLAPEKLDPATLASGSAIVVLSTGAADRCIASATLLNLAPAGSRCGKDGIVGINVDAYVLKSDFPDHHVRLD
jgi:hypothetical protein